MLIRLGHFTHCKYTFLALEKTLLTFLLIFRINWKKGEHSSLSLLSCMELSVSAVGLADHVGLGADGIHIMCKCDK